MTILIVGCGRVGAMLAKTLVNNGHVVARVLACGTTTKATNGTTAGPYSNGDIIRVVMAGDGYIAFNAGATTTASDSDVFMPADKVEYFKIKGTSLYLSCTAQDVYVTLME